MGERDSALGAARRLAEAAAAFWMRDERDAGWLAACAIYVATFGFIMLHAAATGLF